MALHPDSIYHAYAYYRLSKDDGDKRESDSIANQRRLIQAYAEAHDDIRLVGEAYDDGYTGTNFDRPGFRAVMAAVEAGEADCVIVKDLSRLGREYIETGRYLEMVFPDKGVRFIAINDDVDSDRQSQSDEILIPVRNLINESYCRDLSKKLRSQFRLQRSSGEFLGAFAAYGYRKSPEDRHRLVVDDDAAAVVRGIFARKLHGCSQQAIADWLNRAGVLPPSEYKRRQGLRYQSGFCAAGRPRWSATTVRTILQNPLYIGRLVQGKRGTPNYKIKKMRLRRPEDWVEVPHCHEPVVDEATFETVQRLLARDTRTPPGGEAVGPLAGVLFCPDCGRAMCRRAVTRGGRRFSYYVCATYKRGGGCTGHSIRQETLEETVLHAIQAQVQAAAELEPLLRQAGGERAARLRRLDRLQAQRDREIEDAHRFRAKLYEALADALIDRREYLELRALYAERIEAAQRALEELDRQRRDLASDTAPARAWLAPLLACRDLPALRREAVVSLIDRVYVGADRSVRIEFSFRDELADAYALARGGEEAG